MQKSYTPLSTEKPSCTIIELFVFIYFWITAQVERKQSSPHRNVQFEMSGVLRSVWAAWETLGAMATWVGPSAGFSPPSSWASSAVVSTRRSRQRCRRKLFGFSFPAHVPPPASGAAAAQLPLPLNSLSRAVLMAIRHHASAASLTFSSNSAS